MEEHDGQPDDDNQRILDVRMQTLSLYNELVNQPTASHWTRQLTLDEQLMREVVTHWFTDVVYRSFRIGDQCQGEEEPEATLERVRETISASISLALIISKGLANGKEDSSSDDNSFEPPF